MKTCAPGSFYREKLMITIDGEKPEPELDSNLGVHEIGGIQLVEDSVTAEARA